MLQRKRKTLPLRQAIRTGDINGILARLYRIIIHQLGIDENRYEALMERYIKKAHLQPNRKEKAAARASLSKDLLKEAMTWKTFFKGLAFLAIWKFDIKLTLYHENGNVTEHVTTVVVGEVDHENDTTKDSE